MTPRPHAPRGTGRGLRALGLLVALTLTGPALAEGRQAVSQATFGVLQEAERLGEAGRTGRALEVLQRQLGRAAPGSYDAAVLLRSIAVMYLMQDALEPASEHLQRSLDTGALPADTAHRLRYDLATLYMATERHGRAVDLLVPWLEAEPEPSADAHILLAHAYVQLGRYREAVAPLTRALAQRRPPPEPWLQLLLALHHELGSYREATRAAHRLIAHYEKAEYWLQLAGLHQLRRQLSEATAALRLAHQRGFLSRREQLHRLAGLHLHLDLPYEAGRLLESAIAAGELEGDGETRRLLAGAWLRAREYERAAAELETLARDDGAPETLVRLGRVHLALGRWQAAAGALERALAAEGLRDPGPARRLLELARFELAGPAGEPGSRL